MFKFISKIGLIVLAFSSILFSGCKDKTPNYPIIPSIEFKQLVRNADGTGVLKLNFKDGDHDIGNSVDQGSNLFMELYVKNGSNWDYTLTRPYVVPQMDVKPNRAYEGEIDVALGTPLAMPPVSKYLCYVRDRAGHLSNKVWTDEIIP